MRNRLLRAGTSESMATVDEGEVTSELIDLYRRLAANSVGAIITGHMFTHPRGRYAHGQTGIHSDEHVGGLRRLADAVHDEGTPILAQLAHAGSQSRVPGKPAGCPIARAQPADRSSGRGSRGERHRRGGGRICFGSPPRCPSGLRRDTHPWRQWLPDQRVCLPGNQPKSGRMGRLPKNGAIDSHWSLSRRCGRPSPKGFR